LKPLHATSRLCRAALAALLVTALVAAAATSPEQERASLVKLLQKRLPGSTPADWAAGIAADVPRVDAVPLTPEYSTNFADVLAIGRKIWERPFANGTTMAKCFANAGKGLAVAYPQFDARQRKIVTLDAALNECRTAQGEAPVEYAPAGGMGALLAYVRSLSVGQKLNIRAAAPAALEHYEAGKAWFQRRLGQNGYACSSCHVQYAGAQIAESDGLRLFPPAVGPAASWPRVRPGGTVATLQMQVQRCMLRAGASPLPLGSETMNDLEYYLALLANGLAIHPLARTK